MNNKKHVSTKRQTMHAFYEQMLEQCEDAKNTVHQMHLCLQIRYAGERWKVFNYYPTAMIKVLIWWKLYFCTCFMAFISKTLFLGIWNRKLWSKVRNLVALKLVNNVSKASRKSFQRCCISFVCFFICCQLGRKLRIKHNQCLGLWGNLL